MRIIRAFSRSLFFFCIGGFIGAILWSGENNPWWLWLIILLIGELPYVICSIILFYQYCKYRKEFVEVVDDYPSDNNWLWEKAKRRKTSRFPFLYE